MGGLGSRQKRNSWALKNSQAFLFLAEDNIIEVAKIQKAAKARQRQKQMEALKIWSLSSKPFTLRHLLHYASSSASVTTTKHSYSTHVLRCCSTTSTTTTRTAGRNRRQSSSSSTSDRDAIRALRLKKVSSFLVLYVPILCFLVVLVL